MFRRQFGFFLFVLFFIKIGSVFIIGILKNGYAVYFFILKNNFLRTLFSNRNIMKVSSEVFNNLVIEYNADFNDFIQKIIDVS